MKHIMRLHLQKYPQMQITDMVKLLHQSEFAGGQMPTDLPACTPRAAADAFEPIGGGLCRLHRGALSALGLSPSTAARLCAATARTVVGSAPRLHAKLDEFLTCCASGDLSFNVAEAEAYVRDYRTQGCPPVSHSNTYRAAYSPAYHVVKSLYVQYIGIFSRIDWLLDEKQSVTVAIDGNCGAGKSTLAALISEVYDCNVFHTDDFFLPADHKTPERLNQPGGNIDYERLHDEVILGLKSGRTFSYRRYNCRNDVLSPPVWVRPKRLIIIEGVYSQHPSLNMKYDLGVFMKTDRATQRERIRARSSSALFDRFVNEWIPLEDRYFDFFGIEQKSDIVCDGKFVLDENTVKCI